MSANSIFIVATVILGISFVAFCLLGSFPRTSHYWWLGALPVLGIVAFIVMLGAYTKTNENWNKQAYQQLTDQGFSVKSANVWGRSAVIWVGSCMQPFELRQVDGKYRLLLSWEGGIERVVSPKLVRTFAKQC